MVSVLNWFKASDARINICIYLTWSYLVFSAVFIAQIINLKYLWLPLISASIVYSVYSASGPFTKLIANANQLFPLSRILTIPLLTVPCLLLAWPAEKISRRLSRNFSFFGQGMKFYSLNMIGEAIRELEKVKPSTHDTEATTSCYMALGDLYFEDDQYNRAIANYIKARDLNPEDSLIWTKLGRCYFIKSEYKEAADLFMKVIENSAGKLDCEVLAARCRNKIKDFEEAMSRLNANCEHWKTISKDTRENIFARKNIPVSHKPTSLASPAYRRLALNSVARVILIVSVIFISFSVGHKPPADKKTVFTGTTAPPDPVTTANKAKAILPSKNSTLTAPKPEQRKNMAKERSMHRVKSNPEAKNTYLVQHPADSIRFK